MTPTLTEIRTALQNLAANKGRPDYELCTVKQVKFALENGLEHHLIAELPFFEIMQKEQDKPSKPTKPTGQRGYITDEQASEIVTWLKNFSGLYKDLAKMVGCSSSLLIHIKTRRSRCTFEIYNKIMKARKELEGMVA
jgi:antitoxin component HigA of HigAB toxin-antitoxin module